MMLPIAAQFAHRATHERASSALPDAPVVPVGEGHRATMPRGRRRLAAALRRTADRLEPLAH